MRRRVREKGRRPPFFITKLRPSRPIKRRRRKQNVWIPKIPHLLQNLTEETASAPFQTEQRFHISKQALRTSTEYIQPGKVTKNPADTVIYKVDKTNRVVSKTTWNTTRYSPRRFFFHYKATHPRRVGVHLKTSLQSTQHMYIQTKLKGHEVTRQYKVLGTMMNKIAPMATRNPEELGYGERTGSQMLDGRKHSTQLHCCHQREKTAQAG